MNTDNGKKQTQFIPISSTVVKPDIAMVLCRLRPSTSETNLNPRGNSSDRITLTPTQDINESKPTSATQTPKEIRAARQITTPSHITRTRRANSTDIFKAGNKITFPEVKLPLLTVAKPVRRANHSVTLNIVTQPKLLQVNPQNLSKVETTPKKMFMKLFQPKSTVYISPQKPIGKEKQKISSIQSMQDLEKIRFMRFSERERNNNQEASSQTPSLVKQKSALKSQTNELGSLLQAEERSSPEKCVRFALAWNQSSVF